MKYFILENVPEKPFLMAQIVAKNSTKSKYAPTIFKKSFVLVKKLSYNVAQYMLFSNYGTKYHQSGASLCH